MRMKGATESYTRYGSVAVDTVDTGIPCCRCIAEVSGRAAGVDYGGAIQRGREVALGGASEARSGCPRLPRPCIVPACPGRDADDSLARSFPPLLALSLTLSLSILSLQPFPIPFTFFSFRANSSVFTCALYASIDIIHVSLLFSSRFSLPLTLPFSHSFCLCLYFSLLLTASQKSARRLTSRCDLARYFPGPRFVYACTRSNTRGSPLRRYRDLARYSNDVTKMARREARGDTSRFRTRVCAALSKCRKNIQASRHIERCSIRTVAALLTHGPRPFFHCSFRNSNPSII